MKSVILCLSFFITITGFSQSLRDALYSGKLKSDTGTTVRKTDDLSTKMDTAQRKPEPSRQPVLNTQPMTLAQMTGAAKMVDTVSTINAGTTPVTAVAGAKTNDELWKTFIEEFTTSLRTDILPSNKIKGGNYSVLIEYEIGTDGQVKVNNVSSSPESSYLNAQVKERITLGAPQMTPLLNNYGKPRVAAKKQTIRVTK